ncbi:hypothetical protein [Sediminibacillus halophilus]|uniref:Permuted papain-like amidase enzyme, YaeF/YiiX, C92 family n=1 Tax=Sediminibacillus halophilus TaxID=482461 RepID=A0A1G9TP58_9BACI|nr:hypothetical protein [Sediminibacillus halophilus]SDM49432.1 hypothetical protein SAMN05216244_2666 [Sediminibacillus halophilus]
MQTKQVFLVFSDTGTVLGRVINLWTKSSMNHVSIAFDHELRELYSFGRKNPRNPFIGGFVKEDIRTAFFRNSIGAVYRLSVSKDEYQQMQERIKAMEADKVNYRYNFIGLFLVPLKREMQRKNAFFCSQFVATLLGDCGCYQHEKPPCLIRPQDIRSWHKLQFMYSGKLIDYPLYLKKTKRKQLKPEKSTA